MSSVEKLDILGMTSERMQNIPCCVYFLMTVPAAHVEWFIDVWKGRKLVKVVRWTENDLFDWALHVDLTEIGKPGEEAMLPFAWSEEFTPILDEALFAWRMFVGER